MELRKGQPTLLKPALIPTIRLCSARKETYVRARFQDFCVPLLMSIYYVYVRREEINEDEIGAFAPVVAIFGNCWCC